MPPEAPTTITLRVCPECGRNDLRQTMGATTHKHTEHDGWCYVEPEEVTYRREPRMMAGIPAPPETIEELVVTLSPHEWEWGVIGDNNIGVWNLAGRMSNQPGETRGVDEIARDIFPEVRRLWRERFSEEAPDGASGSGRP